MRWSSRSRSRRLSLARFFCLRAHAHPQATMRELTEDGCFGKKVRAWNDRKLFKTWRAKWAEHVNRALEAKGIDTRVDHRRLVVQRAEAIEDGDTDRAILLDRPPQMKRGRVLTHNPEAAPDRAVVYADNEAERLAAMKRAENILELEQAATAVEAELSAVSDDLITADRAITTRFAQLGERHRREAVDYVRRETGVRDTGYAPARIRAEGVEHAEALQTEQEQDLKAATEAAQAAAESNVKLPAAAVSEIYATGETHQAGLAAVERTTKALAAAAAQQLPTETIIDTWKANRSDPGGIAAALDAVTTAAARREEEERKAATEAAQAAADQSNVKLPAAAVSEIYATGETHQAGLAAVERTTKALAAAAAQQLPTETIIDTWKANRSDPGGIAAALDAVTAAVRREEEERKAATEAAQAAADQSNVKLPAAAVSEIYATAQAAADQSNVKLPAAAVSEIYATGETHQAGLAAVERTTKALAAAAAQQLPTETIIDTWKANRSDPGGIAAALDAVTAAVRREEEGAQGRHGGGHGGG